MDEEVQTVNTGTPIPGETIPETSPEHTSSYEDKAIEQGWRPKDEWEGDPEKWRDAKEFVERGELYSRMDSMGKELKETKKVLRLLEEHHSKVRETEYKRAVEELKSLQKKHLEEGNSDQYLETTELLTDLKAEQKAREVFEKETPKSPDPRFLSWVDANKWYAQDQDMRKYADSIGLGFAQQNPEMDPMEVLRYVTKEVKERFKTRFVNPNRAKPSSVEGSGNKPVKADKFELTEDETRTMKTFIRSGTLTKEEYIEEVKRMRGAA